MNGSERHVLLINPTMTSARNARFPLAVLNLAEALEDKYHPIVLDGNIDRDFIASAARVAGERRLEAVGISVMGGPQLRTAIAVSKAIRGCSPATPIIWGGAFPTHCPDASLNAPYVDYVVRGQGEDTLTALLESLASGRRDSLEDIAGLSWRGKDRVVHNRSRAFSAASLARPIRYERLGSPAQYLPRTYLGRRTAVYQAALGCRFRCTFCGVANMFRGKTALTSAARLEQDLEFLSRDLGADSVQFYDHNFFDREVDMLPLLEILARFELPWWCYARTDALANLSERSWSLIEKSRLRMAYVGAESPSDWLLHDIRKGTHADQTLAAIEVCRGHGVTPELSFMLAPPEDPEGETEKTFEFIHLIKRRYPDTEVMIYIYTPLPSPPDAGAAASGSMRVRAPVSRDLDARPVVFPETPDGWAKPQWHAYWCHSGAPWVSQRLRQRILDFTTVLGCRFPTVMDIRAAALAKMALRALASWRYRYRRYDRPWELDLCKRMIGLHDPRALSL